MVVASIHLVAPVQAGWLDPRFDLPGANGTIASLVEFRGALFTVGSFTRIGGMAAPGLARWNGSTWQAIQPGFRAEVSTAAATSDAIYFALNRPAGLLKWDGQNWELLGTPPGYRDVLGRQLVVHGNSVYCEVFPEPGALGSSANKAVAEWDGSHWSILGITSSISGSDLLGLDFLQGSLYGCGALYDPLNPPQGLNVARLVPPNWIRIGSGIQPGFSVYGLATDGDHLMIHGSFTAAGGQPADGFAIWDGSQWLAPPAVSRDGAWVQALTSNDHEVLASETVTTNGPFGQQVLSQHVVQYVGTNRTVLARGDALSMRLMRRTKDGGIYCWGNFRNVGGIPTGNLARWNGLAWSRVGNGPFYGLDNQATRLAVGKTNVYCAGYFDYAGPIAARHIARWDGSRWHPLGSGIDGTVTQMAVQDEQLYVIGTFTSAGGVAATNLARWDGSGWSAVGAGLAGTLSAVAMSARGLLVARTIEQTNFVVSRWDGTNWSDLTGGQFGYSQIFTLLPLDESFLMGGSFERINGAPMNNLARWDGSQWQSVGSGVSGHGPWGPNEFPVTCIKALISNGTNLFVGGSFTNAGGIAARNVARWDGTQWSALGSGIPGFGSCLFGSCIFPVTSLALVDGRLFAGGGFETSFWDMRGHLAVWDGTDWKNVFDDQWLTDDAVVYRGGTDLHVWALGGRGQELYIAGNFAGIGAAPSYGFGIWHEGRPPIVSSTLSNGQVILSWPRDFQRAVLQSTRELTRPNWSPSTLNWEVDDRTTNDVQVPVPLPIDDTAFFRLLWP